MAMTRAEVREAFREVMAADYADVPKREEIDHAFSPEFYARMDTLIAEQKRGTWGMMPRQCKRVLVVAAILAATLMLVACSPILRHAVARLAVTIYETFVDFKVDTTKGELRTEIKKIYEFAPLPEGFELLLQERENPYSVKTLYGNRDGRRISVVQSIPDYFVITRDNEKSEFLPKTANGVEILVSTASGICTGTFLFDGYCFTIRYVGEITQNDFESLITLLIDVD